MEQDKKSVIEANKIDESQEDAEGNPDPREIARLMVRQAMLERAKNSDGNAPSVDDILRRRLQEVSSLGEADEAEPSAAPVHHAAAAQLATPMQPVDPAQPVDQEPLAAPPQPVDPVQLATPPQPVDQGPLAAVPDAAGIYSVKASGDMEGAYTDISPAADDEASLAPVYEGGGGDEDGSGAGESGPKARGKKDYGILAVIFAAPIELHDKIQDRLDSFFIGLGLAIAAEIHEARKRYRLISEQMYKSTFLMMVVICMMLLIFEKSTVYEYAYNGRVLGYVRAQDTVTNILEVAGNEMSASNDVSVEFRAYDNITFKKVTSSHKDTDTADQVVNKLTYMTDIEVQASGIYEDGKLMTIVENEDVAYRVIESVLAYYNTPEKGMAVSKLSFKKDVKVEPVNVMLPSVNTESAAVDMLINGGEYQIQCMSKDGDTVKSLAKTYSVSSGNIRVAESGSEKADSVAAGDVVVMKKSIGAARVLMTENGTKTETIKHKTEEKKTDKLYIGDSEVKKKGVDGRQVITGKITYENGKEVSRDIKNTKVLKEPVTEVVFVGTTERPKTAPTGTFEMPIRDPFNYSSGFGPRWGRNHDGIDLACPTGTPVYATDGGKVTMASTYGGYGYCVDIEHKDGTFSRYGHLSAFLVDEGDEVYQGQEIALVGNTGWSTGSHLHFEIHPNGGRAVDPAPFIGLG